MKLHHKDFQRSGRTKKSSKKNSSRINYLKFWAKIIYLHKNTLEEDNPFELSNQ